MPEDHEANMVVSLSPLGFLLGSRKYEREHAELNLPPNQKGYGCFFTGGFVGTGGGSEGMTDAAAGVGDWEAMAGSFAQERSYGGGEVEQRDDCSSNKVNRGQQGRRLGYYSRAKWEDTRNTAESL